MSGNVIDIVMSLPMKYVNDLPVPCFILFIVGMDHLSILIWFIYIYPTGICFWASGKLHFAMLPEKWPWNVWVLLPCAQGKTKQDKALNVCIMNHVTSGPF